MTIVLASTLPQNTGSGYVAAAYIVFFAILLIYVAIMALRLTRVERRLRDLRAPTEPEASVEQARIESGLQPADTPMPERERETV